MDKYGSTTWCHKFILTKYLSLLNNIYTIVTAGSSRVHIYLNVHQQKDLSEKKSNVMRLWRGCESTAGLLKLAAYPAEKLL